MTTNGARASRWTAEDTGQSIRVEPPIPLVDLVWQHEQIAADVIPEVFQVMSSGAFVLGSTVAAFERDFADFSGSRHCIGVANGTDALELTFRGLGIASGDAVIVPANTFIATAEAVLRAGARPVIVDCNEHTMIDAARVAESLDHSVRAVVPVHLYGQMADMEQLVETVGESGVAVIADAAQAQGASRRGEGIGWLTAAAATSFYPGKNLGAYGDAGAVLTDDDELASRIRRIANHGSDLKYVHTEIGCNSRLDALQAVVLRAKLQRLREWNNHRRRAASRYNELLSPLAERGLLQLPTVLTGNVHVWHLYVVRVRDRDRIVQAMQEAGVGAAVHYPTPIHLQPALRSLGYRAGDFPVAEKLCSEILSLPIYPGITESMQERVTAVLERALHARTKDRS